MAGEPYLRAFGPGPCERARQWSSLRLDGELSELEEALLEKHLESCALCEAFDAGLRTSTELLRTAPLARPSVGFELPAAKPERIRTSRVAAIAAVLGAAALGSVVGSTLQGPAPSSDRPGAQVSFLTRDVSQLRQIPRGERVAPNAPPHQPGGPAEGLI
jgi:predicted anti-sigma-YlaC factor YlaD